MWITTLSLVYAMIRIHRFYSIDIGSRYCMVVFILNETVMRIWNCHLHVKSKIIWLTSCVFGKMQFPALYLKNHIIFIWISKYIQQYFKNFLWSILTFIRMSAPLNATCTTYFPFIFNVFTLILCCICCIQRWFSYWHSYITITL